MHNAPGSSSAPVLSQTSATTTWRRAAVIRCVEVIGEAARQVSEQTRRRAPDIPWSLITGMRNVLAHEYGTVDTEKVYDVVLQQVPLLLEHLRPLIAELEQQLGWREDDDG